MVIICNIFLFVFGDLQALALHWFYREALGHDDVRSLDGWFFSSRSSKHGWARILYDKSEGSDVL